MPLLVVLDILVISLGVQNLDVGEMENIGKIKMLNLDELLEQVNDMKVTDEQIERLSELLKEKDLQFEKEAYERLLKF